MRGDSKAHPSSWSAHEIAEAETEYCWYRRVFLNSAKFRLMFRSALESGVTWLDEFRRCKGRWYGPRWKALPPFIHWSLSWKRDCSLVGPKFAWPILSVSHFKIVQVDINHITLPACSPAQWLLTLRRLIFLELSTWKLTKLSVRSVPNDVLGLNEVAYTKLQYDYNQSLVQIIIGILEFLTLFSKPFCSFLPFDGFCQNPSKLPLFNSSCKFSIFEVILGV